MALPVKKEAIQIDLERVYTPEEFEALPQFDELYELVESKLVKKVPGDKHGRIADRIAKKYHRFDLEDKLGQLWASTTFDVGTGWRPIPDLAFITADHLPPEDDKSVRAVPDLVVEIHSPSDLDSKPGRDAAAKKIRDWQAVGVKIIWAINPRIQTVEIYRQGQARPQILQATDELDGETIITGFKMKINELFN